MGLALVTMLARPVWAADPPSPAPVPPPPAESAADGEVENHVSLGQRLFQLGRYEEAVAEFRRAYELRADARFLYQIAECYRELGAKKQALFYYDRYLAGAPSAPDRDEVEQKVADLGGPRPATRPRPRLLLEPAEETPAKAHVGPRPWRRWWFWTAIGLTLAAGATAVMLDRTTEPAIPTTDLGNMGFF